MHRYTWIRTALALGLLAAVLPATAARAASATGSPLGENPSFHTATLLTNGQVLVAGGCCDSSGNRLAAAELYNPSTGTWTPTGSMHTARQQHTATLLPNGQVLVAGGFGPNFSFLSSAELYNPATGTWSTTGSLKIGRYNQTATLLKNGKVLVAGGIGCPTIGSPCVPLTSGELYNPSTSAWNSGGTMNTGRYSHTATLLPNGQVLVSGGLGCPASGCAIGTPRVPLTSAELYTPSTNTWTTTGSMAEVRASATATLLKSGQVLVVGGCCDSYNLSWDTAELYNPSTGAWSGGGGLINGHSGHTATLLANGQVLIAGGSNEIGYTVATAELYSSSGEYWSLAGRMATGRAHHTATLLNNGEVLVTGGFSDPRQESTLNTAELYSPATGTWSSAGTMSTPRWFHTAMLLQNGEVLVAGGASDSAGTPTTSADLFNPATDTWSPTGALNTARYAATADLLANGDVLLAGGCCDSSGNSLSSTELYNPSTGTWSMSGSMHTARWNPVSVVLPNGQVLVAGGEDNTGQPSMSAELYNPSTGTWTTTGSMHTGRVDFTATMLSTGKVLVAGGCAVLLNGSCEPTSSAELYDPSTGTWSTTSAMYSKRFFHTATLLPNGQVLVAGGCCTLNGNNLPFAELYNPATGTWNTTISMQWRRELFTATLLPNGTVLAVGGFGYPCYGTSEFSRPSFGTWSATGSM